VNVLDLFCGQGGAGMGYYCAGFDVVGVDLDDQPRYPFEFVQADALDYLAHADLSGFDLIHASPPCQRWCYGLNLQPSLRENHPDLIEPTREALERTGIPYVIENVPGAPVRPDLKLCGCHFRLWRLKRERWFETSWKQEFIKPPCNHNEYVISVFGHSPNWENVKRLGFRPTLADWQRAMGIDWMGRKGLAQAIPPAYTEYLGWLFAHYYFEANFGLNRTYDY
jgi:DNA (cytosine-5)-methyltransferase 1